MHELHAHREGAALLECAQQAGEIRPDAEMRELILTAHSAAWIAEQTKIRRRWIACSGSCSTDFA